MKIHSEFAEKLTTQSYGKKPTIGGVEILSNGFHADDGGSFAELFRVTDGKVDGLSEPFLVRQVSLSLMLPGTIKSYHIHLKQDDLWFTNPTDRLLVNLHDIRQDSETYGQHMRFILGAGKNMLVRIPAGVAHGVANPFDSRMTLMYATSQQFNASDPDEHRLPWDEFGGAVWEVTKG